MGQHSKINVLLAKELARICRSQSACGVHTLGLCFKIVVYAKDGWIWGAAPCGVEPSFLHFDARDLDCDPTTPLFDLSQSESSSDHRNPGKRAKKY
jgi:hypothetical protein